MTQYTATVSALTAEVRVLMVGSRQVTLSVYRQLDRVHYWQIEPLGRVRDSRDGAGTYVVGRRMDSGDLVRSDICAPTVAKVEYECAQFVRELEADIARTQRQLEPQLERIAEWREQIDRWDDGTETCAYAGYRDSIEIKLANAEAQAAATQEWLQKRCCEWDEEADCAPWELDQARQLFELEEAWQALPLIVLAGLT